MIVSQALLQRERGVAGTALPDVLEHSGAPRGSIYHHFPDGRAQLAEEATEWAAGFTSRRLESLLASGDVVSALDAFIDDWTATLRDSEMPCLSFVFMTMLASQPSRPPTMSHTMKVIDAP